MSVKRLPYYLLIQGPIVVFLVGAAIGTATGGFWTALFVVIERIAATGAASAGMIIVVEGFTVGAIKIFVEKQRAKAREEGCQEGRQEERERLRNAGVSIPADDSGRQPDGGSAKKS